MAQASRDAMTNHRVPHGLADHEPDPGVRGRGHTEPSDLFGRDRMNDEPGPAHSPALPGHQPKVVATGQSSGRGEQASQADRRLRPLLRRAARIARPARVRMRSRNPWVRDRRRLFGWKVRLLTVDLPGNGSPRFSSPPTSGVPATSPGSPSDGAQNSPTPRGRPYKVTHPCSPGLIRVPFAGSRAPLGDTPRTVRCLLRNTSCGIARRLLACVLLVGRMGVGALLRRAGYVEPSVGSAAARRTFVHSCGQPCGCFPCVGARPSSPLR